MDSVEVHTRNANSDSNRIGVEYPPRIPESSFRSVISPISPAQTKDLGSQKDASEAYRNQLRRAIIPIQAELGRVEQSIRNELASNNKDVAEMLAYVGDLGGKRLRPTLLLLSAKSLGEVTDEAIRLSVVVELVHTATLVHDDVLDNALMRRHKQTVHTRWTVPASVLVGDWLFTHAYALANHGTSTIPGRWIADAAKQVCEGEMMQGKSIGHFDISVAEYVKLLDAKTGALCAVSCSLGAWSSGADENTCHALQQFGLKLGTAFQVFDDWLDVWGQAEDAGKTLGTDLASFKPTLPALRTLETMEPNRRDALILRLNAMEPDAASELRIAMEQSDASAYTKQFAMELVTDAVEHLDRLKPSEAVSALKALANAAVRRTA